MEQLAGALQCSSRITSPYSSATMRPLRGFLTLCTRPLISAYTEEYSKQRSASSPNVQFSSTRFSA